MKKGDIFEGIVEKLDFPNKGIIHVEGERVTVKNVIPGQRVRAIVGKRRNGRWEGRLLEIVEPSSLETAVNPCRHFGICGGCNYQTLSYGEQLKIKEEMVKKLIGEYCPESAFEGILAGPKPFGYRNKMEYSFGDEVKGGPLMLGMHKRGSFHDIVTVEDCRIADGDFQKILMGTLKLCREKGLSFYQKMKHTGYLRHLLVRKAWKTGELLVALVTSGQTEETGDESEFLDSFTSMIRGLSLEGSLSGVLHMKNDSQADVVKSDKTTILYGRDFFYEELLGLRFKITPFSFFQTNSSGAEVLYSTVRNYIGSTRNKVVYDLYSGTGTIAQLLAPVAEKVIGVEIVEEAVMAARENAALNGLSNCEFLAGDVLKVLNTIQERPDFIVLDPPRDGIHPKALPQILAYGVEQIIYVSCKPTSLARDLKAFMAAGYQVQRACAVDMFPMTANVETVCLLSKLNARQHIEIEVTMDELDLTAAEKKATYQEIKDYVLEHTGLKVSSLYIAQVKQKCGIIER